MLNGAFFTASGAGASSSYARASSLAAKSSSLVSSITASAGSLSCRKGSRCWAEWMIQEERTHPILLVYDMIYYIVIKANNACQVTVSTSGGKKVIQLFCICNSLDIFFCNDNLSLCSQHKRSVLWYRTLLNSNANTELVDEVDKHNTSERVDWYNWMFNEWRKLSRFNEMLNYLILLLSLSSCVSASIWLSSHTVFYHTIFLSVSIDISLKS